MAACIDVQHSTTDVGLSGRISHTAAVRVTCNTAEVLRVCGNLCLYAIMCCSLVLKLRTDYLPTLPCFIVSHIHSTENVY